MFKWHAAINESIHKYAFFVYVSVSITEPFATPKKSLNWKAENIPTHSSHRPPG